MLPLKIGFVLKQAGTANALLPLIEKLKSEGAEVLITAYEKAHHICERSGLTSKKVSAAADVIDYFRTHHASKVITGTSLQSEDDGILWDGLKSLSIPSIAYIEQWCNIEERFMNVTGLPDKVWIIDETAAERLLRFYPVMKDRLEITGSPALESKINFSQDEINKRNKIAYFISQPMRDDDGQTSFQGYSQFHNFKLLKSSLSEEWKIKVFLHPIDTREAWAEFLSSSDMSTIEFIENGDKAWLMNTAGLIAGVTSILLVETAIAGLPTISLQLGKKNDSDSYGIDADERILKIVNKEELNNQLFMRALNLAGKKSNIKKDSVQKMLNLLGK